MRTTAEIAAWREENPHRRLDLSGANLGGADLYGANLYGANLYGADLRGANLGGTNGIYLLNMCDPRCYVPYSQVRDGVVMVGSGCRYYTLDEAREHWGPEYGGDREIGDRYLAGLAQLDCDAFRAWVESQRSET